MSSSRNSSQQKLKPVPCPLFSCGIFRNCTQSVLSPTANHPPNPPSSSSPPPHPHPPPDPLPNPPPPTSSDLPPTRHPSQTSSSSSSSSTSPSFTQWRFPLHHTHSEAAPNPKPAGARKGGGGGVVDLSDAFQAADLHFRAGSALPALRLLEKSLASDPSGSGSGSACPKEVMAGVVASLRDPASARPAAKVLLALLLSEPNRQVAVNAGAVSAAIEAVAASGAAATATAERALAALELLCTVDDGAEEVRSHALAAPVLSGAVESMAGGGWECGIGVLAAVYGGEWARDAPTEVGRAVVAAMQGECSARGKRKGVALMRALQENGRLDVGNGMVGL